MTFELCGELWCFSRWKIADEFSVLKKKSKEQMNTQKMSNTHTKCFLYNLYNLFQTSPIFSAKHTIHYTIIQCWISQYLQDYFAILKSSYSIISIFYPSKYDRFLLNKLNKCLKRRTNLFWASVKFIQDANFF